MQTIKFKHEIDLQFVTPVVPANKALPAWYKNMPLDHDGEGEGPKPWNATARSCMPFLDAMTQGYVIPLWSDMHVVVEETSEGERAPRFSWGIGAPRLVDSHPPGQTRGLPLMEKGYGETAYRLENPWCIQTPPGYSSLLVAPLNNAHPYLQMFSAVVATDVYFNKINFTFVYTGPADWEGVIPIGTPVMQIIPFKRVDFKHEI